MSRPFHVARYPLLRCLCFIPIELPHSRSLYTQLTKPPEVKPMDWKRSRIRRDHLIHLGVPIDLDEVCSIFSFLAYYLTHRLTPLSIPQTRSLQHLRNPSHLSSYPPCKYQVSNRQPTDLCPLLQGRVPHPGPIHWITLMVRCMEPDPVRVGIGGSGRLPSSTGRGSMRYWR